MLRERRKRKLTAEGVCPCLGTGVRAVSLLLTHGGSREQSKDWRLMPVWPLWGAFTKLPISTS